MSVWISVIVPLVVVVAAYYLAVRREYASHMRQKVEEAFKAHLRVARHFEAFIGPIASHNRAVVSPYAAASADVTPDEDTLRFLARAYFPNLIPSLSPYLLHMADAYDSKRVHAPNSLGDSPHNLEIIDQLRDELEGKLVSLAERYAPMDASPLMVMQRIGHRAGLSTGH